VGARGLHEHWRPNAYKQSETAFSDGTLRLVGLLWSIAEKGGPLLLEEPELSLNDAVVAELPRMFSRMQSVSARQIITTTHSTALLDDPMICLKEVHRIDVDSNGSRVAATIYWSFASPLVAFFRRSAALVYVSLDFFKRNASLLASMPSTIN